jgi:hypothetical protein
LFHSAWQLGNMLQNLVGKNYCFFTSMKVESGHHGFLLRWYMTDE